MKKLLVPALCALLSFPALAAPNDGEENEQECLQSYRRLIALSGGQFCHEAQPEIGRYYKETALWLAVNGPEGARCAGYFGRAGQDPQSAFRREMAAVEQQYGDAPDNAATRSRLCRETKTRRLQALDYAEALMARSFTERLAAEIESDKQSSEPQGEAQIRREFEWLYQNWRKQSAQVHAAEAGQTVRKPSRNKGKSK
jgi:hypothetical protein